MNGQGWECPIREQIQRQVWVSDHEEFRAENFRINFI